MHSYGAIYRVFSVPSCPVHELCAAFALQFQKSAVLGSEEYECRRTVKSAPPVVQNWRELIAQADFTVPRKKRCTDHDNFHLWRLKFPDHTNQRRQGPIFEISHWTFQKPAKKLDLAITLTFEKMEATAKDVLVFRNTL